MIDRLSSGHSRFDELVGGGLPAPAINLIAGAPGTGKTMLAEQFAFHNASPERPAVYLSTTTEPIDKLIRYGQELSFFDKGMIGTSVLYESLLQPLMTDGLQAVLERVLELLRDVRPGILVFDSFRAFRPFATDDLAYRAFVAELSGRLAATQTSTFWVGEYAHDEVAMTVEAAVADAIIVLRAAHEGQRTLRLLEVSKLRGSRSLSGEHAYRLSDKGLDVFPRLADPVDTLTGKVTDERISLGSGELDEMLEGGVWKGTATLVIGSSGVGKTMLGLDFLAAGAAAGRRGVFASLQETPGQITRVLNAGGRRSLEGWVEIHRRSPVDIYIDEWIYEVLQAVERTGAELLLIDSLSDLRLASPDQTRFEEYVYSLGQRCARMGTTVLMTLESRPAFAFAGLIETALSHLADNIILLGYRLDGAKVTRAIHVLKTRASGHDATVREFTIDGDGITIGGPTELTTFDSPTVSSAGDH
jgi:circadian clock protein KaiC